MLQKTIVLLSCVKSKEKSPCKAYDMYISSFFKKKKAYAESLNPNSIYILSAKYGLISLNKDIEPYNQTLKNMKVKERLEWTKDVIQELKQNCNLREDKFILLAGKRYRENIIPCLTNYEIPMEGLRIGQQMQWLDRQLQ